MRTATIVQWGVKEWEAMDNIVKSESNYNPEAQNGTSTAYGIFQFLNTTWNSYGCKKTADPDEQIRCGILYIAARYQTPTNAYSWHLSHGWY